MSTNNNPESNPQLPLPMGSKVLIAGTVGIAMSVAPLLMLIDDCLGSYRRWLVPLVVLWACLIGWPFTYWWSAALHERIDGLKSVTRGVADADNDSPQRVAWIPAWIGLFERGVFCLLIGTEVPAAATFIGGWIALKLAGGWQVWSKGTTYGRAIFFTGLLGNMMSALFGVVGGIVVKKLLKVD